MTLLRDEPEFSVAVERAARELGDLDPAFVEKDYWVTQVLRALHLEYPHGFVFKGGTSLSKGYSIIERFSEDIDILVVRHAGASAREAENHLRAITGSVSAYLNLDWEEGRAPGRGRDASRGDLIRYEPLFEGLIRVGVGPGSVLLETGYGGGHEPSEMVWISPMMSTHPDIDPSDYEDTVPFQLRALEPRRTLIEKLFAVHHVASLYDAGERREEERFGRHFYDIDRLLDDGPTLKLLNEDRDGFDELVTETERISARHFGGTTPRPAEGFAASPAFAHDREGGLREWLEEKYSEVDALLPGRDKAPSFGSIMKRVAGHADVL